MSNIILCAMEKEAEFIKVDNAEVYVTGIGCGNVIKRLQELFNQSLISLDDNIINVGYAGSSTFDVGEIVAINQARRYIDKYKDEIINLPCTYLDKVSSCNTADDFIKDVDYIPLVDMELYYIACFGFTNLKAFKIVSDNLNEQQYYNFEPQKSWDKMNYILNEVFNG